MNKFVIFLAVLATLLAVSNGQYFSAYHGVEFPRYGKRSESNQESYDSTENDKSNLQFKNGLNKSNLKQIPKEKLNDYFTRRLLLDYLLKSMDENN